MEKRRRATLSIVAINVLAWMLNIIVGGGSTWGLFISGGGYLKEYGEVAFGCVLGIGKIVAHFIGVAVGVLFGYVCNRYTTGIK